MIIQIPFSGFYESIHTDAIDNELFNGIFTDTNTGITNNDNLSNRADDSMDWNSLHIDYAKEYASQFAKEFDLKLEFESLHSPKYYNFSTDRIFCHISENEILRLWRETIPDTLEKTAKEMFTSCDGFISFYDSDFRQWGNVLKWDYNQLHCLLMAWLYNNERYSDDLELDILETMNSNGFISEILFKNCPIMNRLEKIFCYLDERAERL